MYLLYIQQKVFCTPCESPLAIFSLWIVNFLPVFSFFVCVFHKSLDMGSPAKDCCDQLLSGSVNNCLCKPTDS